MLCTIIRVLRLQPALKVLSKVIYKRLNQSSPEPKKSMSCVIDLFRLECYNEETNARIRVLITEVDNRRDRILAFYGKDSVENFTRKNSVGHNCIPLFDFLLGKGIPLH